MKNNYKKLKKDDYKVIFNELKSDLTVSEIHKSLKKRLTINTALMVFFIFVITSVFVFLISFLGLMTDRKARDFILDNFIYLIIIFVVTIIISFSLRIFYFKNKLKINKQLTDDLPELYKKIDFQKYYNLAIKNNFSEINIDLKNINYFTQDVFNNYNMRYWKPNKGFSIDSSKRVKPIETSELFLKNSIEVEYKNTEIKFEIIPYIEYLVGPFSRKKELSLSTLSFAELEFHQKRTCIEYKISKIIKENKIEEGYVELVTKSELKSSDFVTESIKFNKNYSISTNNKLLAAKFIAPSLIDKFQEIKKFQKNFKYLKFEDGIAEMFVYERKFENKLYFQLMCFKRYASKKKMMKKMAKKINTDINKLVYFLKLLESAL